MGDGLGSTKMKCDDRMEGKERCNNDSGLKNE